METTAVKAQEVYCENPSCPALARNGATRYLGLHFPGCRVPCPKCNKFTDVR